MKVRIRNLRLGLEENESKLKHLAAGRLGVKPASLRNWSIARKAVDARRQKVVLVYTVDLELPGRADLDLAVLASPEVSIIQDRLPVKLREGEETLRYSPVIVGSGPAGLFCALGLARYGYRPVVIERGREVRKRAKDVEEFWQNGVLNPESNVQFGEGGAGTFSDGKLITRIGDERVDKVLETFVNFGAPEEIRYLKKPHIGTDRLRKVVEGMRRQILEWGGEVYFGARLTDIDWAAGRVRGITVNHRVKVPCSVLVLATGNGARDVYRLLADRNISLVPKGFAVGVRVEHAQALIDTIQYGQWAGHPRLGPADYHLTYQDRETGRSLYTFCMCPGGYVIAAASEPETVVTNGMSYYDRDSGVANSALVVTVAPSDWDGTSLGGVSFQEEVERKAFAAGRGGYQAPAQLLEDFLAGRRSSELPNGRVTYKPGVTPANLWEVLPLELARVLQKGITEFGRKMKGFIDPAAVLTGVETRTSAPVRIERGPDYSSVSARGLYPCGEGAGYAGGIVSSAVDGLRVAETIITTYKKPLDKITLEANHGIIDARSL